MDEELINLTTEETIGVDAEEVVESEIRSEDLEQNITTEETVETVEVETVEEINIEIDEAVGWVGGDSTRHYSLYGRDEADQHPITAITGLREELNDIEALDVVYSDERNQANYYLWEDENVLQEDRVGYFVSACPEINEIKLCTSDNDIFGVTVDSAGFVGAQADIARDIKYGLVVTTGIVHVRCESSVNIGDYVISNDYGYAQKNDNGYKVVGRHLIDGVEYAEITLVTPINRICKLSDDVENVNERMDNAETNIVAAINMANAAYNKAGEATSVSEEVLKDALEALKKSEDTEAEVDKFLDEIAPSISETWEQAQAIAESAATSALTAKDEAIATANDAWAKSEDVSKEFQSLTAKIDQYSVGEYSQAYGLTLEQAASILKAGMIYVPTKHLDMLSHSEIYSYIDEDSKQQQVTYNFTPGNHYEWDGNNWVEYGNTVAFFSEEPTPSRVLQYWYIDSNEAPEGYEAHALYIWDDSWQKVNILEGNVNNRMTSMIRQTTDRISAEVANARGSIATLSARLTNTEATVENTAQWAKGKTVEGEELYNIATIKQSAGGDESSLALVVADTEGNKVLKGASIVLGQGDDDSYIRVSADNISLTGKQINIATDGVSINAIDGELAISSEYFSVNTDGYITATGGTIGGWHIGDNVLWTNRLYFFRDGGDPDGYIIKSQDENWNVRFGIKSDGNMYATGGTIAGWTIDTNKMYKASSWNSGGLANYGTGMSATTWSADPAFYAGFGGNRGNPWAHQNNKDDSGNVIDGPWHDHTKFYVTNDGKMCAKAGSIAGWTIDEDSIYCGDKSALSGNTRSHSIMLSNKCFSRTILGASRNHLVFAVGNQFGIDEDGEFYAKKAHIEGTIDATSGSFGIWNIGTYNSTECIYSVSGSNTKVAFTKDKLYYAFLADEYSAYWDDIIMGARNYDHNGVSDKNVKNSISNLDDSYDSFFDELNPCKYKYNSGTSDRFHTGFIAQEVVEALKKNQLGTTDFAAVMKLKTPTHDGAEWMLRRDEFVALNTWQIQKAKSRISELETQVSLLTDRLEALENKK